VTTSASEPRGMHHSGGSDQFANAAHSNGGDDHDSLFDGDRDIDTFGTAKFLLDSTDDDESLHEVSDSNAGTETMALSGQSTTSVFPQYHSSTFAPAPPFSLSRTGSGLAGASGPNLRTESRVPSVNPVSYKAPLVIIDDSPNPLPPHRSDSSASAPQ